LDFLLRFVLVDIPEAFLLLMIGFAIFNLSVFVDLRKTFIFSFVFAVFGEVFSYLEVPYQPKVLLMFAVTAVAVHYLFSPGILKAVFAATAAIGSMVLTEFILIMIYNSQQIYWGDVLSTTTSIVVVRTLYLLALFLFGLLLRVTHFDIRRFLPRTRHNRYLFLLVFVGSIEFLLILFTNTSFILRDNNVGLSLFYIQQYQIIFQILILVLFILIILLFRIYVNLTINRVEEETGTPYMKNIHDMLMAIRSIKHDSLNHYTAINGFLKKGLYDLAKEYVEQLLQETVVTEKKVDSSSHILEMVKNPAVSTLLQSKMAICLAERITLSIDIQNSNPFSRIKTYDLVKLLGNLLDNAIRATSHELEENRYIRLEWGPSDDGEFLLIENSGPVIPPDKLEDIFQMGYTTKKNGEGGLGLTIVKSVTDRYGGTIRVNSDNGVTRFYISFPNR